MDRFKLTKQDRINQYKIIMYNVKGDLECYTRPNIVRRLDKMGFFDAPASINHHGAYSGALFDHSLAVTGALLDYTDKMGLTWSDARSPYIAASLEWDIAFDRNYIRTNSGEGCKGNGGALDMNKTEFDDVPNLPTSGYEKDKTATIQNSPMSSQKEIETAINPAFVCHEVEGTVRR